MRTKCWLESLNVRDHLKDAGIDETIILKWILAKWDVRVWTGFTWLSLGAVGGILCT
jgi:hypothetical protein